ncbi:MAG: helix-turn-helix domain-containing protein [Clostridia bacterium]|nr:helix-turn-helix domain-containing protein [Clostridia bacterium]
MAKENTQIRLRRILTERNLRQIDLLNLAKPYCEQYGLKLSKSDLSQYLSGKVEPAQNKLFILAKSLNVDPAWLMGLDVPMTPKQAPKEETTVPQITDTERQLLEQFKLLSPDQQEAFLKILQASSGNAPDPVE